MMCGTKFFLYFVWSYSSIKACETNLWNVSDISLDVTTVQEFKIDLFRIFLRKILHPGVNKDLTSASLQVGDGKSGQILQRPITEILKNHFDSPTNSFKQGFQNYYSSWRGRGEGADKVT